MQHKSRFNDKMDYRRHCDDSVHACLCYLYKLSKRPAPSRSFLSCVRRCRNIILHTFRRLEHGLFCKENSHNEKRNVITEHSLFPEIHRIDGLAVLKHCKVQMRSSTQSSASNAPDSCRCRHMLSCYCKNNTHVSVQCFIS